MTLLHHSLNGTNVLWLILLLFSLFSTMYFQHGNINRHGSDDGFCPFSIFAVRLSSRCESCNPPPTTNSQMENPSQLLFFVDVFLRIGILLLFLQSKFNSTAHTQKNTHLKWCVVFIIISVEYENRDFLLSL